MIYDEEWEGTHMWHIEMHLADEIVKFSKEHSPVAEPTSQTYSQIKIIIQWSRSCCLEGTLRQFNKTLSQLKLMSTSLSPSTPTLSDNVYVKINLQSAYSTFDIYLRGMIIEPFWLQLSPKVFLWYKSYVKLTSSKLYYNQTDIRIYRNKKREKSQQVPVPLSVS